MRIRRARLCVNLGSVASRMSRVVIRNAIAQFIQAENSPNLAWPAEEPFMDGGSGALTDNDDRGRDERADEEAEHEYADDDAEPLDEVHVSYLDRLRRPHPEDHRYPRVSREGGRRLVWFVCRFYVNKSDDMCRKRVA